MVVELSSWGFTSPASDDIDFDVIFDDPFTVAPNFIGQSGNASSVDEGWQNQCLMVFGTCDSLLLQNTVGNYSENNVQPTKSARSQNNSRFMYIWQGSTSLIQAEIKSIGTTLFNCDISGVIATQRPLDGLAISGAGQVAVRGITSPNNDGAWNNAVTGLPFEPKAMIMSTIGRQDGNTINNNANAIFGFGMTDGVNQFCMGCEEENANSTPVSSNITQFGPVAAPTSGSRIVNTVFQGLTREEIRFVGFTSDGCDLFVEVNQGLQGYYLTFFENDIFELVQFDTPTGDGQTVSITGLSMDPAGGSFFNTGATAVGTIASNWNLSIGGYDAKDLITAQHTEAAIAVDGASPNTEARRLSRDKSFVAVGASDAELDIANVDSSAQGQVDLLFSQADGTVRKGVAVFYGDKGPPPAGKIVLSRPRWKMQHTLSQSRPTYQRL